MTTAPVKAEAFNKTVWRVETSAGVYEVRAGWDPAKVMLEEIETVARIEASRLHGSAVQVTGRAVLVA